ncbi:MAG: hypothetical protein AMXMBFR12_00430 [Candidatus Babeliales bacterium]
MKIKLVLFCASQLVASGQMNAMMRSGRVPVRRPVAIRNYCQVAHIQAKYALPKACPPHMPIAELAREQLVTHLKHQELCWKAGKFHEVSKDARKQVVKQAAELVKISVMHGLAAKLAANSGNDVGYDTIQEETVLSLKMVARAAVSEYQKIQKDATTAEQALAELVAEQKRQLRMLYDIQ